MGLSAALIILGLILVLGRPEKIIDNFSNYTFEREPVKIEGFSTSSEDAERSRPKRIIIPDLSIDLRVGSARVVSGYWEVFPDMAGWGEGSGLPGESGNQVIFAHAREGLFLPLKDVSGGMRTYVLTEDGWYEYEIVEIKEVYPNQTEVIEPTDDETLTLYTCAGFADSKRLIAVAKRI